MPRSGRGSRGSLFAPCDGDVRRQDRVQRLDRTLGGGPPVTSTETTFASAWTPVSVRPATVRPSTESYRPVSASRACSRPSARPAAAPSLGSPCRRRRALASPASQGPESACQEPLTGFVRFSLCSMSLQLLRYTMNREREQLPPAASTARNGRVDRRLAFDARTDLRHRFLHPQAPCRVRCRSGDGNRRRSLDGLLRGTFRHRRAHGPRQPDRAGPDHRRRARSSAASCTRCRS